MKNGSVGGDSASEDPRSETPRAIAEHFAFVVASLLVVFVAAVSGFEWWLERKIATEGRGPDELVLRHTFVLSSAEPRQDWRIDWGEWDRRRGAAWADVHCRMSSRDDTPGAVPCELRARTSMDTAHQALLTLLPSPERSPSDWRSLAIPTADTWQSIGVGWIRADKAAPILLSLESANGCFGAVEVSIHLRYGELDSDHAEAKSVTLLLVNLAGVAKLGSLLALVGALVAIRLLRRRQGLGDVASHRRSR